MLTIYIVYLMLHALHGFEVPDKRRMAVNAKK